MRHPQQIPEWDVVGGGGINSDYTARGRELPGPGTSLDAHAFLAAPGGKGANAAVAAARLGARTALIGCVGDDDRNLVAWESGEEWLPDVPVDRVDTTGAGDAFSGALAVALAEGQSLADAGRFASIAAALSTTALGAQPGLPRRRDVDAYRDRATTALISGGLHGRR